MSHINFEFVPEAEEWSTTIISLLAKWGLGKLKKFSFRFNEVVKEYQHRDLLIGLFQSPALCQKFEIYDSKGESSRLSTRVMDVNFETLDTTIVSMSFFDPLSGEGIIRPTGTIKRCFEENMSGFWVQNELQKELISDESAIFCDEDKNEFIYKLFYHTVLGGGLCQFEERIEAYLDVTKLLYKDMVRVHNREERLEVANHVFRINQLLDEQGQEIPIFPHADELGRNILYVSFDPYYRVVNLLYCPFETAW